MNINIQKTLILIILIINYIYFIVTHDICLQAITIADPKLSIDSEVFRKLYYPHPIDSKVRISN